LSVNCSISAIAISSSKQDSTLADLNSYENNGDAGSLTNKKIKVNIPDGCYEKAQMGLELIKSAIMELAKANPKGIKNSDAAKYLGLQSDYGGGSKDYLSYSILGILMKEGRLERNEKKNHVAKSE